MCNKNIAVKNIKCSASSPLYLGENTSHEGVSDTIFADDFLQHGYLGSH